MGFGDFRGCMEDFDVGVKFEEWRNWCMCGGQTLFPVLCISFLTLRSDVTMKHIMVMEAQ